MWLTALIHAASMHTMGGLGIVFTLEIPIRAKCPIDRTISMRSVASSRASMYPSIHSFGCAGRNRKHPRLLRISHETRTADVILSDHGRYLPRVPWLPSYERYHVGSAS